MTINMASARKKLDEKNLKILRELVSLPENKHCFDCHQRGPTYVNVTIGSFVCTTCSGMLRGLTPPHRVKSISMATFTSEEIDLLKSRGNEYCRKVWLGLYDGDEISKDEQQIKEFMIAKYERKRYYIKPSDIDKVSNGPSMNVSSGTQNIPRLQLPSSVSFQTQTNLNNNRSHNNNLFPPSTQIKAKETVKIPAQDPFRSASVTPAVSLPTDNFANFDDNPIFNSSVPPSITSPVETKSQPPSEDRYAALKDLDSLMKSQSQHSSESSSTTNSDWETGNVWSSPQAFSQSSVFESSVIANKDFNPFSVGRTEVSWNNAYAGNPFNTDFTWMPANGQVNSNGIPVSQSIHFNSAKHWNSGPIPNPFTVSSNGQSVNHHSSNPFL